MVELSHLSGGQWFNFKQGLKYEEEAIVESFNFNALLAQLQCRIQQVHCNTIQFGVWCTIAVDYMAKTLHFERTAVLHFRLTCI